MSQKMVNGRKVLAEIEVLNNENQQNNIEVEMTVEEYLEQQCQEIIKQFQSHTLTLIQKLKMQYEEGAESLQKLMKNSLSNPKLICVQLKCTGGGHIGQKFRLEAVGDENEDVFKIGRSTGRLFKEKGVSVYKDKEISTTHAKIEVKNGSAFLVDLRSTNGTSLNGNECEALLPYRLGDGDVIFMGSTELKVQITAMEDAENDEVSV